MDPGLAIVRWPWSVVVAIVGTGTATFLGLLLVARVSFDVDALSRWTAILIVALLLHVPCFVGLLLRRSWARYYAAAVAFGWVGLMVLQVVEQFQRGGSVAPREWFIVLAVVLGFSGLTWTLMRSPAAARYFLSNRQAELPSG